MKEILDGMIDKVKALRSDAFKLQNEELYRELGRAMANLIRARDLLK